jgi:lysozyme family protein
MANFEKAVDFVLAHEGGYTNDPNDPGGETKYGISKRAYPDLIIANLTPEDAIEIYRRDYWIPSGAEQLPDNLALIHFDASVNNGLSKARQFLDQAGGDYREYLLLRIKFYNSLAAHPTNRGFLRGWINRALDLWELIRAA